MLVKFIYHFPPVLLFHVLQLRRVYLLLGGRKRGGEGGLGQDQVKKETEVPGLSQRAWRTSSKAKYVRFWEYVCVWVYVWESDVLCVQKYVYLEIYICIYVHVGALKNMCV